MNTELPPSIIVDDHGTIRDAMLVDVRAGMATYKIVGTRPPTDEPLRKALADCVECLKRLPAMEAYRVTCLSQAQQALGMGHSGEPPATRLEADTNRAMDLIRKVFSPPPGQDF